MLAGGASSDQDEVGLGDGLGFDANRLGPARLAEMSGRRRLRHPPAHLGHLAGLDPRRPRMGGVPRGIAAGEGRRGDAVRQNGQTRSS